MMKHHSIEFYFNVGRFSISMLVRFIFHRRFCANRFPIKNSHRICGLLHFPICFHFFPHFVPTLCKQHQAAILHKNTIEWNHVSNTRWEIWWYYYYKKKYEETFICFPFMSAVGFLVTKNKYVSRPQNNFRYGIMHCRHSSLVPLDHSCRQKSTGPTPNDGNGKRTRIYLECNRPSFEHTCERACLSSQIPDIWNDRWSKPNCLPKSRIHFGHTKWSKYHPDDTKRPYHRAGKKSKGI